MIKTNIFVIIYVIKGDNTPKEESKNDDSKYQQDINITKYYVSTLFAPSDPTKFFDNQEVIIPTQILISDNDILTRVNATPNEKIQLLTMYKNIINTYGLTFNLNIFGDYQAVLKEQFDNEKLVKVLK